MSIRPHGDAHAAPQGMIAHTSSAGTNESIGARMNNALFTCGGSVSSFMKFFTPSASGWK